jgi:hypothetical protein
MLDQYQSNEIFGHIKPERIDEKVLVGKNMSESDSEPERTPEDAVVSPSVKQKAFAQTDKRPSCSGNVARFSIAV